MADVIEIQKGDTLTHIARDRNTSVSHLATTNGISNPDRIYAGDPLVVPSRPQGPSAMTTAPQQPTAPTPSPHAPAAPAPDMPPQADSTPPAQPQAPDADTPPEALDGVEEGEEAADAKSDEEPEEVVCNCPEDEEEDAEETEGDPPADDGKPPIVRAGGDENVDVLYAEGDANAESMGALGTVDAEARIGAARMDHAGTFGDNPVGGSQQMNLMTAGAKFEGGIVNGAGLQAQADATGVSQRGSLFLGSDENNPLLEGGAAYTLGSAEAKANGLLGNDGTRRGIAFGAGAQAAAVKGDLDGGFSIPIPFTDWTFEGRGKLGGSLGSAGLAGNVQALQDLETGRYHAGVSGAAALLAGIGIDVDLSLGPAYTDRQRPNGP